MAVLLSERIVQLKRLFVEEICKRLNFESNNRVAVGL